MVRRFSREDFFAEAGPFSSNICGRRVRASVYFAKNESGFPIRCYSVIVQIGTELRNISPGYVLEQSEMDELLDVLRRGDCPSELIGKYSCSL